MTEERDITEFMAQAQREDPVGYRATELALDIEFALAGQLEEGKVPGITAKTTIEDLARIEQATGARIKVVSE